MSVIAIGQITIRDQNSIETGNKEPSKPWVIDMLWLDTSGIRSTLKQWNGLEWIKVNDYDDEIGDIEEELDKKPDRDQIYTITETDSKFTAVDDRINLRVTEDVYKANKEEMERLLTQGKIYKGSTRPPDVKDTLWLDQSVIPHALKIFDGEEWVETGTSLEEIRETINNVVSELEAQIDVQKDEINASVDKKITDSADGITEQNRADLNLRDDKFTINLKRATDRIDGNDRDLSEINSYFNFMEEGLGIGKSDSPLNINISNEQMDFLDNGKIIAYINGQQMYIDSLEILSGLVIGVHKIEKYNEEITLIKYVGDGK